MKLTRIGADGAERLWKMQVEAFQGLYEKYQDKETNPAAEQIDQITARLNQPFTYYYFIEADDITVGAVRVVDRGSEGRAKRISPIFIMENYRNRGYAQEAIRMVERIHGSSGWELDTILQEKGNCHLYEKMGYHRTGKTKAVNDKMTLVSYEKGRAEDGDSDQ